MVNPNNPRAGSGLTREQKQASDRKSKRIVIASVVMMILALALNFWIDSTIERLETPRDQDIFLVSYPKSGNNWLRFLLGHAFLYSQGKDARIWQKQLDFNSIEKVIPDLEYGPNRKDFSSFGAPRFFKSHQPFAPQSVRGECDTSVGPMEGSQCNCPNCPKKWRKVVHLVRDGRDVMCSYYHFRRGLQNLEPLDMTFKEFLSHASYPGYDWARHVQSFFEGEVLATEEAPLDVLLIKYEDLHEHPTKTMTRLCNFAGLSCDEEVIAHAIENSSFKRMRIKEEMAGLKLFDEEYPHRDSKWRLTRKGTVGGWGECFTDQASKDIFNAMALPVMKQLGYLEGEDW